MDHAITVLFFATLKDAAGIQRMALEYSPGETVADLKERLAQKIPALEPAMGNAVISVNQEFAEDDVILPAAAEVAVFPPVSGGSATHCVITDDAPDMNEILRQVTTPEAGAVCFFVGVVRGRTEDTQNAEVVQVTEYLEYEAYKPMAEAKMGEIAEEMRERWPAVGHIYIVQRVGHLSIGEVAAVIACTGAHRHSGVFEAAAYAIERLKQIVPVWKKEAGPNGTVWVEGEYIPHPSKE
jgi:molybdopterin converting factor subunit 1